MLDMRGVHLASETNLCGIYSKCECCSAVDGQWIDHEIQCERPDGEQVTRTLAVWTMSVCQCQDCNGSYITYIAQSYL